MRGPATWRLFGGHRGVAQPTPSPGIDEPMIVHRQEAILRILLRGTFGLFGVLFLLVLASYTLLNHHYVLDRLIVCGGIFVFLLLIALVSRRDQFRVAARLLVGFYLALALTGMWMWGINLPFTLLLIVLVIILSGILLGSRAVVWAASISILGMLVVQGFISTRIDANALRPDFYITSYGDALGYSFFFVILTLVAWLFGAQLERSLRQAQAAEEALQAERDSLEVKLDERTKKLRAAQVKEMQQIYKFAELGQLSTSLLHDLANHLTVLTFDIEDIHLQQRSEAIASAKEGIKYLDHLVDKVRSQIQGDSHERVFSVISKTQEVITQLKQKAVLVDASFKFKIHGKRADFTTYGDPTRFGQVMTILLSNAIDAVVAMPEDRSKIVIEAVIEKKKIYISVHDWGKGIPKRQVPKLFKPFFSSKENGMGIGLFIAHQMTESHFKGKLWYEASDHTVFRLQVPRKT